MTMPWPDALHTAGWIPISASLFIGSFLGTVVTRLPAGRSVLLGRSICEECHHKLGVFDLFPVLSWITAGRRCRHCGAPVGAFYALIELSALGLALWAATIWSDAWLWISCGLAWCLLALAVIDIRDGLLPDVLTLPLVVSGLAVTWVYWPEEFPQHVVGALAGYAALWLIRFAYQKLRRRDGLGLGDAKLFAAAGAWLSWWGLPSVLLYGSVATLIGAIIALRETESIEARHIPFGPGLCLGFWLVWLYGPLS